MTFKAVVKYVSITLVALVVFFFVFSYIVEYRPADVETVTEYSKVENTALEVLPDTIKLVSWNMGYAGLGDNMDCCFDGGKGVRDSKERTQENLRNIIAALKKEKADIYLLQEVDLKSRRTYDINEVEAIAEAFPDYHLYYARNFKVWFVPSPLKEPTGHVDGGLLTLSKVKPGEARRIQYPSSFSFPVRMFNLKRCLLEEDFRISDGRTMHIGNTHNTAFDTSGMREQEDAFVIARVNAYAAANEPFVIVGDWNQCPPQHKQTKAELENEYFKAISFDTTGLGHSAQILCDTTKFTMRFNDKPYDADSSTKSVIDFFLVSGKGVQVLDMHTIDLNFHSSDHNPVSLEMVLLQNL